MTRQKAITFIFVLLIILGAHQVATATITGISAFGCPGQGGCQPSFVVPIVLNKTMTVTIKGQFVDLATRAEVSGGTASLSNQVHGSNSSVDVVLNFNSLGDKAVKLRYAIETNGPDIFKVTVIRGGTVDQIQQSVPFLNTTRLVAANTIPVNQRVTLVFTGSRLGNATINPVAPVKNAQTLSGCSDSQCAIELEFTRTGTIDLNLFDGSLGATTANSLAAGGTLFHFFYGGAHQVTVVGQANSSSAPLVGNPILSSGGNNTGGGGNSGAGAGPPPPNCMDVTMPVNSAIPNSNIPATASIARCFPIPTVLASPGIPLTVTSNNAAIASPPTNITPFRSQNDSIPVQIATHTVTACTAATLTFSTQLAGTNITQTKTLTVCPFNFDIGVANLAANQIADAGQDSVVAVTITNQGAQTLFANSYRVDLSTQENTTGMVRDSCPSASPGAIAASVLPDIAPGQQQTINLHFHFPQAGNFTLVAKASIGGSEDGPSTNNTKTQAVNVPLPRPLVCNITPTSATAGQIVTIKGNWFRRFGTNDVPTVLFGNQPAQNVQVISPLEITAQVPNPTTLHGQIQVTVTNNTGATTATGPTLP